MLSRIRNVLAVLVLAGLAACGPQPPAVAPPILLPSPSGGALSVEAAAARYQQIVAPYNEAAERLWDDIDRHVDWRKVKQQVIALADIRKREVIEFASARWPDGIAGHIDEMIRRLTNAYTILYTARDASDPDELNALLNDAATQDACPVATLIRVTLKLPPPVPPCIDTSAAS